MSGESGRHSRPAVGQQVRPEPVVEKTFVENVAGFINEVTPQTYSNPSHYEGKETILWVRFDYCDINDLARFRDKIEVNGNSPPLLLIVGYSCGVQAWVIPVNGEAVEVLSWRQGAVRVLKVLPTPLTSASRVDHYSLKRPIIALCDTAGPGPHFCSVSFISLKTGEQVKIIKFKHPVHDIQANKNIVVITFLEKLAVFDASTLDDTFTVTTCYPSPGPSVNPIALGDRWLAYADRRLIPLHQSFGGMVSEGTTSYKATVIHAAKSLTKGLKELSESVASNLMGQRGGSPAQQATSSSLPTPGIVTVIDTQMVGCGELSLTTSNISGIIAHFAAHHAAPVVALSFDPTGMLLLTADKQGHSFHLFRLQPHPLSSAQSAVHHLYTLHRGDTTAKVTDISFSLDSRWVAVSTHRGTTHVFPITPYGGVIGVRTHTSSCVVNRLSRFHRSAGLDDTPSSGRNSPVLSASPSSSKFAFEVSPNMAYPNPRYPPYPTPTVVKPLVQLRQPLLQNLIGTMSTGPSPSRSPPTTKSPRSPSGDDIIKVASVFGSPRGWLAGSPTVPREKQRRTMDSLFVMACHGNLLEYQLEPQPASGIPQDKVTEDSPIELYVHASAQWALGRESTSGELRPPLDLTSPLLAPLSPTRPRSLSPTHSLDHDDPEERWMAQVEIHTHAGPHRRLWMGPQFTFKSIPGTGAGFGGVGVQGGYEGTPVPVCPSGLPPRSSPVNMPGTGGANVPVLIEAGSLTGSHDQSPRLMERYSGDSDSFDPETIMTQLRHDLADAMMDTHHSNRGRDTGGASMASYEAASHESTLDMTDVMDISCDPPGPSPGRSASSTASSRPASHVGEEIQAVSARLYQVPVTPSSSARASPHIQRSPSLEDNRALTSSAEELSTTLGSCIRAAEIPDSVWVPIEKPEMKYSKYNSDFVEIDVPAPVPARSYRGGESPRDKKLHAVDHGTCSASQQRVSCQEEVPPLKGPRVPDSDNHKSTECSEGKDLVDQSCNVKPSVTSSSREYCVDSSRSAPFNEQKSSSFVLEKENEYKKEKDQTVNEEKSSYVWRRYTAESNLPETSQSMSQEESYPPLEKPSLGKDFTEITPTSRTRALKGSPSTTTSEDDLWLATEKKDQKKKKKKRSKILSQEEESHSIQVMKCSTQETQKSKEKNETGLIDQDTKSMSNKGSNIVDAPLDIDIDTDYFHAAQEYHEASSNTKKSELLVKEHIEHQLDEFQEARESVVQNLEDFELHGDDEDKEMPVKHADDVMLKSLHDENDLARALEEAYSSDDNVPTQRTQIRTRSRSRPARTSEMFPFKDETSDEEEENRLRRRLVVSATITVSGSRSANEETSTDDRGETSGDDRAESSTEDRRTGTSESDVAASPNPRANSSSKNKKKKKKKR
ncbi:BCAS3 microtubule associated cell migration factor-like isoform X2 [Eriocheir sinensis]|uniref:BCAS3 microtubule associated cell migration factor-like isoform X2 n=1 Tax=Eriocheir sinensis TaxID=95602 RepID=UPI0021C89C13|nr:BCAS3 microtubule associated cell migration factor-like isoform X2 [Eriocheir sinensis]